MHPNGDREWWNFGKRHRVEGPAIISVYGDEWWSHGYRQATEK